MSSLTTTQTQISPDIISQKWCRHGCHFYGGHPIFMPAWRLQKEGSFNKGRSYITLVRGAAENTAPFSSAPSTRFFVNGEKREIHSGFEKSKVKEEEKYILERDKIQPREAKQANHYEMSPALDSSRTFEKKIHVRIFTSGKFQDTAKQLKRDCIVDYINQDFESGFCRFVQIFYIETNSLIQANIQLKTLFQAVLSLNKFTCYSLSVCTLYFRATEISLITKSKEL